MTPEIVDGQWRLEDNIAEDIFDVLDVTIEELCSIKDSGYV